MATTVEQSGAFSLSIAVMNLFSGDTTGARQGSLAVSNSFDCTPDLPDVIGVGGFASAAVVTCAAGNWLLADPADPFQGMGNAVVDDGMTPVGKALKILCVYSDPLNTEDITLAVGATNGCPVMVAANDAYVIKPGGVFLFFDPTGEVISALTSGSNDKITISVSGGAPTAQVLMVFGE